MKYQTSMSLEQLNDARALLDSIPPQPLYVVATDDDMAMSGLYVGTVDRGTGHDQTQGLADLERLDQEVVAVFSWQSKGLFPHAPEIDDLDERYANFFAKAPATIGALIDEVRLLRAQLDAQPVATYSNGVGRWVL
jgi:hypothetical protein